MQLGLMSVITEYFSFVLHYIYDIQMPGGGTGIHTLSSANESMMSCSTVTTWNLLPIRHTDMLMLLSFSKCFGSLFSFETKDSSM
jgi:hypothetical protein